METKLQSIQKFKKIGMILIIIGWVVFIAGFFMMGGLISTGISSIPELLTTITSFIFPLILSVTLYSIATYMVAIQYMAANHVKQGIVIGALGTMTLGILTFVFAVKKTMIDEPVSQSFKQKLAKTGVIIVIVGMVIFLAQLIIMPLSTLLTMPGLLLVALGALFIVSLKIIEEKYKQGVWMMILAVFTLGIWPLVSGINQIKKLK